jgi:outer membrane protein TolC
MLSLPAARAAIRSTAFLVVVMALTALQPALADAPLTLEDAQRMAVERSRLVDAQDSAAAASRQMAVAAGQLPDPVLSLGVTNLPVSGSDAFSLTSDPMTMKNVGVMQEWTRAEKRQARSDRYEREADKAIAEKVATIASLERDTARAWLDRYYAEAQLAVISEQTRQARLEVDAAEDVYRAGRGSLADILTARSTLVGFDDRTREVRARVSAAAIALARYIGEAAARPLSAKPQIDELPIDRQALEIGLEHHPQIASLEKREEVAAADVKVAQANRKPDWSVQVMYGVRGPGFPDMISLGVSVPLPWDRPQRQDRELAARLATLDQARAEREDAVRAHRAEVHAMLVDWDANRERSTRYANELLPLAQQRTEAVLAAFRGAKASLADVLAARRNEIEVRLQALALEADAARAWAQLAFLVPAQLPIALR